MFQVTIESPDAYENKVVNYHKLEVALEWLKDTQQVQFAKTEGKGWLTKSYYSPYKSGGYGKMSVEEAEAIVEEWGHCYERFCSDRFSYLYRVASALNVTVKFDNNSNKWNAYYLRDSNSIHFKPEYKGGNLNLKDFQHELVHAIQNNLGELLVHGNEYNKELLPTHLIKLGAKKFNRFFALDESENFYKLEQDVREVAAFGLEMDYYHFNLITWKLFRLNLTMDTTI